MTGEISLIAFGIALSYHPRIEIRAGRHARQNIIRIEGAGTEVYRQEKIYRL